MIRQIIVPTEKDHTITLPTSLYGKQVEILISEVMDRATPPVGKPIAFEKLFDAFGADPNFPDTETLQAKAWPEKW